MVRGKDACWEHCVLIDASRQKVRCNYCQREFSGGVYRMKFHLAQIKNKDIVPCTEVPDDVRDHIRIILTSPKKQKGPKKQNLDHIEIVNGQQNSSSASGDVNPNNHESNGHHNSSNYPPLSPLPAGDDNRMQKHDDTDKKVALFFLHNGIPFNAAKSVYYQEMVESITECGVGYKAPNYEKLQSSLQKVKTDFDHNYKILKSEWNHTGCTILCESRESVVIFSVTCPKSTIYLKSVDIFGHTEDAQFLYELLESVVLEVGLQDVVQVITDSSLTFVYAGRLLMAKYPSIFWSPCASDCVNKILEDFSKLDWVNTVIEEANTVITYIYGHELSINIMRKYINGIELIRAKLSKYVAVFVSLRSLVIQEDNLKHMFSGVEWVSSNYYRRSDFQSVKCLLYSENFWKSANEAVSISEPLIKILRILEGDMPVMGYIYEVMERVKMEIKGYYNGIREKYMPIWEIIDGRWNMQIHSPLHAAAAFLNPKTVYNLDFKIDLRIRNGFQEAMLNMANDDRVKSGITKEHPVYLNAQGALGTDFAIMGRTLNSPGDWWLAYGYEIPTLQKAAVRILSQPCSSHWCKWNWKTFENLHAKTRNKIEHEKYNDLVFVHCNLRLQAIVRNRLSISKPIVFEEIDVLSQWPTEIDSFAPTLDDSWLDTLLPFESTSTP